MGKVTYDLLHWKSPGLNNPQTNEREIGLGSWQCQPQKILLLPAGRTLLEVSAAQSTNHVQRPCCIPRVLHLHTPEPSFLLLH